MSHLYQISLKSVLTLENGMKENVRGENLLSITLVYPREGIKSMESIKKLKLKSGTTYSFKDISFSDKLLFKESIQGDSAIIISLTAIEKVAKIRGIIQDGIKAGVIAGVGLITGGAGITILTAVTKSVIGSLFDLAKPKDKLTVMGKIDFPINNQLEEGELVLNLTVPKKLTLKERKRENGQEILLTKTLEKGFGVAKVILDVKKIPKAEFVLHPVPQV